MAATNFGDPCWACRLFGGEARGPIVAETPEVVVAINIYGLPDALAGPIMLTAANIARAVKRVFNADAAALQS